MRIVIAEDLALLRDGLARLLRDNDCDVVAEVADADALVHAVLRDRPDLAIVDIRLPPTFRDEGLRAALELRRTAPETAILILSQYVEHTYAAELRAREASATCSRTASSTRATSSRRCGASRTGAPPSTPRWCRSSSATAAASGSTS
jgi:DNA-binding NarL/FixJ family response regulator